MKPFINNNITNKNTTFSIYSNPTEANKIEYSYAANNDINLESHFNQPYIENISNSYDINYLPGTSGTNETYNNYSYTASDTNNSENNNNYYLKYFETSNSNEYITNTNYNNYENINYEDKSNISNFATVKPLQVSIKNKNENINYYYNNNNDILNPSKNV